MQTVWSVTTSPLADPLFMKVAELLATCTIDCSRQECVSKKCCLRLFNRICEISSIRPMTRKEVESAMVEFKEMQKGVKPGA